MELSSTEEGEIPNIPIPINSASSYGTGGHGHGHGHMINIHHDDHPSHPPHDDDHNHHNMMISNINSSAVEPTNRNRNRNRNRSSNGGGLEQDHGGYSSKKVVMRYRECLKNHAAAMGGNATDGCGEFMPSGEEGTIEALNCSACHCHRNFHRKEVEGLINDDYHHFNCFGGRKFILQHNKNILPPPPAEALLGYPTTTATSGGGNNIILPSRAVPPHHHHHPMILPNYNIAALPVNSESDHNEQAAGDHDQGAGITIGVVGSGAMSTHQHMTTNSNSNSNSKKRFRTKFTQEQKEKMLQFADKVGWKIQKQEESVVQQFCQEIGVKRRVLKVWMHNNKHNLAAATKRININPNPNPIPIPIPPTTTTTTTTTPTPTPN